ncbi:MAG TPA: NAD-dependent deacylase, partial [Candidatus Krumholzibacteria bacterium]|nr:NAD-dependent deacylase [Candidatus Krumholzibacteria bacterium]
MTEARVEEALALAAELLLAARDVVVTTGAGMSKESGIATFRDAQT